MSGQRVGYTRVSSLDQNADRQLDGVALDRVFTDSASGRSTARPQLEALLAFVRDGDTVLVHSMDRLARLSLSVSTVASALDTCWTCLARKELSM
jgi:DNA invertase Pin-like site-specific DNA recombinase